MSDKYTYSLTGELKTSKLWLSGQSDQEKEEYYNKLVMNVWEETGKMMPYFSLMAQYDNPDRLHVFRDKVTVRVFKNGLMIREYIFHPGFITDKGSVPAIVHSIVDNDDPNWIVIFYLHDADFVLKRKSFDACQEQMNDLAKTNPNIGFFTRKMVVACVDLGGYDAWTDFGPFKHMREKTFTNREFVEYTDFEEVTPQCYMLEAR